MSTGKLVFSLLVDHLPWDTFHRYVKRYNGNHCILRLKMNTYSEGK